MELISPDVRVPVPKPPSYVKLDMAFGVGAGTTLFDKSRYRAHGAISGADWAAGLHGYCLKFVMEDDDHVEILANHTHLNFTSEDFSLIARILVDDIDSGKGIFCRGEVEVDGWYFSLHEILGLYFVTSQLGESQWTFQGEETIEAGTWYTAGFSRSGAACQLYINGVAVSQTSAAHVNPVSSARTPKIGIRDDKANEPNDGKIEFLRIFGGIALPATAHLAWHNALA